MQEFISEDDLKTFEGWLKYQGVDAATSAPEELEKWQGLFDEARKRSSASPKVGLMKLQPVPGEHQYAVAVREGFRSLAGVVGSALAEGQVLRVLRHGAARRSRLGHSHELSP